MNYYEKVLSVSDQVLIYFANDLDLIGKLDEKYNSHREGNRSRYLFWQEVRGRIRRNSSFTEIFDVMHLEKTYYRDIERVPDPASLVRSPVKLQWVNLLYPLSDAINDVFDYQIENDIRESKYTEEQITMQNLDSMRFFNDRIKIDNSPSGLFPYLTLLRWAIEGLIATKQLSPIFYGFIKDSVIPVLRAQRQITLVLLELMDKEDEYIAKGLADDVVEIPNFEADETEEDVIRKDVSQIFTRYFNPEPVKVAIPPESPIDKDIYLCPFAQFMYRYIDGDGQFARSLSKDLDKDWFKYPISSLYRMRMHAETLGIEEEFMPAVSPKLIAEMYKYINAHIKVYSEPVLLKQALLHVEMVAFESDKENPGRPSNFWRDRFNDAVEFHRKVLSDLVSEGLILHNSVEGEIEKVRVIARDSGFTNG